MPYHSKLFVFDIETVPDIESGRLLLDLDDNISSSDVKQKLIEYHLNITSGKNPFLRQLFHKVVCVSFLEADIEYLASGGEVYHLTEIRSGGDNDSSEKDLISGFFQHLSNLTPRLVSFNGKMFDMPVLKYRAMKYGVQAKWLYLSGDKWSNYNMKYNLDWHCDLLDALSDFGASARIKMNEVCSILGIPGKLEVDGSMVDTLYEEGKIEEIRNYCELDVLSTYLVYLKYKMHTGILAKHSYNKAFEDVIKFLSSFSEKKHFQDFLEEFNKINK